MQQLSFFRPQYTTVLPPAIEISRDAACFLPLSIYLPAIAGTYSHAALIMVHQVVQEENVACMIMQYAEDPTPQLIKRGIVPVLRAVSFMHGQCMTAWDSFHPVTESPYIYLYSTFNAVYVMLDSIFDAMQTEIEKEGGDEPDPYYVDTQYNVRKLKKIVLTGETKLWLIHANSISIETQKGFKKFYIQFTNFWIWFNNFLEANSDYSYQGHF